MVSKSNEGNRGLPNGIKNDFGFEVVEDPTTLRSDKATQLMDMIIPLLDNLAKNPELDYIKWPNRKKVLDEFRKRLYDTYNGFE